MNLLTKIKIIILFWVITTGFCLFLYWLGGGNFERDIVLALIVGLGSYMGISIGFLIIDNTDISNNKDEPYHY